MPESHPRHVVAVTGVVTDAWDRVLPVRGDPRALPPPGGQVKLGEDLVAAPRREIREESGCEVGGLVGVYSNPGRPEEGIPEQVHLAFPCEWTGDECSDAGWFVAEAPQQKAKLRGALANGDVRYRAFGIRPHEALLERGC